MHSPLIQFYSWAWNYSTPSRKFCDYTYQLQVPYIGCLSFCIGDDNEVAPTSRFSIRCCCFLLGDSLRTQRQPQQHKCLTHLDLFSHLESSSAFVWGAKNRQWCVHARVMRTCGLKKKQKGIGDTTVISPLSVGGGTGRWNRRQRHKVPTCFLLSYILQFAECLKSSLLTTLMQ